jgi:hypothetical protein
VGRVIVSYLVDTLHFVIAVGCTKTFSIAVQLYSRSVKGRNTARRDIVSCSTATVWESLTRTGRHDACFLLLGRVWSSIEGCNDAFDSQMYVSNTIEASETDRVGYLSATLAVLPSGTSIEQISHPIEILLKPRLHLSNCSASTIDSMSEYSYTYHGDTTTASIVPDQLMW